MDWDSPNEQLLNYYRKLTSIRKESKAIKTGDYAVNIMERRIFGFVRFLDDEIIYVACNGGHKDETVRIPVLRKAKYIDLLKGQVLEATKDYYGVQLDQRVKYESYIEVTLKSYQGIILKWGK